MSIIRDLRGIILGEANVEPKWGLDLASYALASISRLSQGLNEAAAGSDDELEIGRKLLKLFPAPASVSSSPFPLSEDLWSRSVASSVKSGKAFGGDMRPNYAAVVSAWTGLVESAYGFVPTKAKRDEVSADSEASIARSAAEAAKMRRSEPIDAKEVAAEAKKLISASASMSRKASGK